MPPKSKVLVISDSKAERESFARAFESRGIQATVASPFELGFAAAREQPDLVLLDVGNRTDEQLKALLSGDPIACRLVLTSDGTLPELRDLAARWRAAGHVSKTGSPDQIVARVEPWLVPLEAARKPAPEPVDFAARARSSTRSQFVTAFPFPLLVSSSSLVSRHTPKTAGLLDQDLFRAMQSLGTKPAARPGLMALAIRKSTEVFPDRITLGRAHENDIVIDHATLSKLHAIFVKQANGFGVADAGSRNGSWVSGRLLTRNAPPSSNLESGDTVRFGELEFTFLSPSSAWDSLRVNVK